MVEILMSTYNGRQFLQEQLDSILNQSFQDWTLLIRDDSSSDNTPSIIDDYCRRYPAKIKKLESDKNIGCLRSFEELLKNSEADYYMFCDQDDVWLEDKIKHAVETMENAIGKESEVPCVVCSDLQLVDENLNSMGLTFWDATKTNVKILDTPEKLSTNNYVAGCTMLFNNAAKKVSMPFGRYCIMHDAWITLKTLAASGTIFVSPYADILYRQHRNNTVGATKVEGFVHYLFRKAANIKIVLKNNYANYLQANEILSISLPKFIFKRISYLLHR